MIKKLLHRLLINAKSSRLLRARQVLSQAILAIGFIFIANQAMTGDLTVSDGAVVKFGQDAQLVVRDKLTAGKGVVLTSQSDDKAGGQVAAVGQSPVIGTWNGLRFEKSAAPNALTLDSMTIRYAGSQGNAGLTVLGFNPTLQYMQITDNTIGLQLLQGASPVVKGSSFLRNGIGIDADGNSLPVISNSQFVQNSTLAIQNKTPTSVIQALNNWWGSNTGPNDPVNNPAGLGDAVSTGVNYGSYLTDVPLINPTLKVSGSATFTELQNITLELNCANAVEYRIAENGAFTGLPYQPMVASLPFSLSAGDGLKKLSVQYRASSGNTVIASLTPDLLYDSQGPTLALTTPAEGSYILNPITITATATDAGGVAKVDFYINNQLVVSDTTSPYSYYWNTAIWADGNYAIKVVATDSVGHTSTVTNNITKAAPPPDTSGPTLGSVTFAGTAVLEGTTLSKSGTLVAAVSDPSGVAKVEFLLDGILFGTDTNGADGYSATFDIYSTTDGSHTLTIRATDSLGNKTESSLAVTVALAAPATPVITAPANNTITPFSSASISGTASPNVQIIVYKNAAVFGTPVAVDSAGKFTIPVSLDVGINLLQVAASNRGGSSALSAAVQITYDNTIPDAPVGLNAAAQPAGKIKLSWNRILDTKVSGYNLYRSAVTFNAAAEAVKVNTALIPVATTIYDDLPTVDGTYFYRIVAVNSLNTSSTPSNIISGVSDNTLPKATSIVYVPTGKVDSATGRIGAGRVNVTVNVSEALSALPFLSIAPQGGTTMTVDLVKQTDTIYTGFFVIAPGTPAGTAYAVFSARDIVGNRGTEVLSGTSLKIDAQGPSLTGIALAPIAPIKNDANAPVSVVANFTLNEAMKSGVAPQISYVLSATPTVSQTVTGLTQVNPTQWSASFTLPATAGQNTVERLAFAYVGSDDLDNVSTTIMADNSFQVYQGTLPPLGAPLNMTAVAQAGGKVLLSWSMVDQSIGYQLYRQAPGEGSLTPFLRLDAGTLATITYTDATTVDGLYRYSVASIRSANGQESASAQSLIAEVTADSIPPGAPQNLALVLVGSGIQSTWLASTGNAASYNLYRSSASSITSTAGLTPIKTNIRQLGYLDSSPSQAEHAYAATAVDAAGNESALSNSAYLNFALLPVKTLTITQIDSALPQVSWTHAMPAAIAGYDIYLGDSLTGTKLNLTPLSVTSYSDTGYAGDERSYTVVASDSNGVQASRSLSLPKLSIELVAGTPILRNVMNRLQYKVSNLGTQGISNAHVKAKIGTREISSEVFGLAAGESKVIPVVVGGYADITNPAVLISTIETSPNTGELIDIVRSSNVAVQDGALVLTISPDSFTRGGTGKVSFTLENTSDVEIELLTATNSGTAASTDIRYKLLDKDGNVLIAQALKQALGNVITINTGQTVARIPARGSFTSEITNLNVPSSAPDNVTVQLEIDNIRYHLGTPEAVSVPGLSSRKTVSLIEAPYYAEVTNITPANSFGDQDIIITGRAIDRASLQPLGNVALKMYMNVNGFERRFDLFADTDGSFKYTFKPTASDGGVYKIAVVHPDIIERPVQGQFVINSLVVSPTTFNLKNLRNYPYTMKFRATAGAGTVATNVHVVYEAANQPSTTLPAGIKIDIGAPLNLASAQAGDLAVTLTGDNSAAASGSFVLKVFADEKGAQAVATITVNYILTDSKAAIKPSPSFVESGVAQGGSVLEQITLENNGYAEAQGVTATLINSDGTAAPSWIYLVSGGNIGNLVVGEKRALDIAITPPVSMVDGIYTYKLRVASANTTGGDIPIYVSLTQAGIGNVLIKAADIYTGTLDAGGQRIAGMAGGRITLQNEVVTTVTAVLTTDSLGEAYFTDLPAGRYKFRATAPNHQEIIGRLTVKPGITVSQDIFLDYNLVTVEWTVTPITIKDSYTITAVATFVTNVPAPVVLLEPLSVTLPVMKPGDVFLGEFTLKNYGLVRADNLVFRPPASDAFFRYEFMANIPTSIEAKQTITIPYRVVSLTSLDQPVAAASGGGCSAYSTGLGANYNFACANGTTSSGSASASINQPPTTTTGCGGGGGGGGWGGGWDGGWDGGGGVGGWGGGGGSSSLPGAACVPPPCETCGGNGSGS
jgi:fibronectin type 3 domain-containing protein